MRTAYIAIGYACNHHCIFCPCSGEIPRNLRISIDDVFNTVNDAIKIKGLQNVLLSGGEPTVQSNFFEILEQLSRTNLAIGMLSNADRLADKQFVNRIISLITPNRFSVTTALHSHVSEKHDKVTKTNGSFYRSLGGLKNLVDAGVNVTIKHCITKLNFSEMEDFTDFVYTTFPDSVNLLFCSIDYCGMASENKKDVAIRFDETGPCLERVLDKVVLYRGEKRIRNVVITETPLCAVDPYYWSFFSNSSKEKLTAYNSPISGGNNPKPLFDVPSDCGTFFNACKTCAVEQICPGTWRTACELFGENAVSPIRL